MITHKNKEEKKIIISYNSINIEPQDDSTIGRLFFSQVKKFTSNKFISFMDKETLKTLTWKEFETIVIRYITFLKDQNINKGDLIGIYSQNSPHMLAVLIAVTSIGAIACPVHTTMSIKQKNSLLKEYDYKLIFASESEYNLLFKIAERLNIQNRLINIKTIMNYKLNVDRPNILDIDSIIKDTLINDIAYIMLSSGTTGIQKGIQLTHDNILSNIRQVLTQLPDINSNDSYLSFLPFSHSYGGLAEIYQAIYCGASYHFYDYTDIEALIKDINTIKPTVFQTVPRIWEKLYKIIKNNSEKKIDFSSINLRLGFSAGAHLAPDIVNFFYKKGLALY